MMRVLARDGDRRPEKRPGELSCPCSLGGHGTGWPGRGLVSDLESPGALISGFQPPEW